METRAGVSNRDWKIEQHNGLTIVRCRPLERVPGVGHAFSTRRADGAADFDLGAATDEGAPWEGRRRRLAAAAGLEGRPPVVLLQVHGARILPSSAIDPESRPEADAVLDAEPPHAGTFPAIRVADCVPLLLAAADGSAVAAVHAGWRGTAAGIVPLAVEALARRGAAPERLEAALGPAIGCCCYEVGPEVFAALSLPVPGVRRLDLRAAQQAQLERAGVPRAAIRVAPWCTACSTDLFFSHRREGRAAGRMMACIGRT